MSERRKNASGYRQQVVNVQPINSRFPSYLPVSCRTHAGTQIIPYQIIHTLFLTSYVCAVVLIVVVDFNERLFVSMPSC